VFTATPKIIAADMWLLSAAEKTEYTQINAGCLSLFFQMSTSAKLHTLLLLLYFTVIKRIRIGLFHPHIDCQVEAQFPISGFFPHTSNQSENGGPETTFCKNPHGIMSALQGNFHFFLFICRMFHGAVKLLFVCLSVNTY